MKVLMLPTPTEAAQDDSNSINQIVLRLQKALPQYGVELTEDRAEADLVVAHAGQTSGVAACDIVHLHGFYPTAQFPELDWHWSANQAVINNVLHARQVTVPSAWVADILRRDLHLQPHVVGWAIDPAEWQEAATPHHIAGWEPANNPPYVLWNKTRPDGVCDPAPMIELAKRANQQLFLTTFGEGTPNIKVVGRQPFEVMKEMVRHAAIYLATTKETFGIGTLEALACGVPVLGYAFGATADLVDHGSTGFLVQPGDIDGLYAGLDYCLKYRAELGANARRAAASYTWDKVAEQFAAIYRQALEPRTGPKVSVVIPCHNYARYVEGAIRSVQVQETTFDFDLRVVVDFPSTDNSYEVAGGAVYDHRNPRLASYIQGSLYGGPAQTRNAGIEASRGEYIVCLDADDMLGDPHFLQTLADALDGDPTLGIAFTALKLINEDGTKWSPSRWPDGYDFDRQIQGANQVPTCCMFRREAWQRVGGYRQKYTPAEDADFWLRMGALGYHARQVTADPWFLYRFHTDSLSAPVRDGKADAPNWHLDKGWVRTNQRPLASDGRPPRGSWPVRNYDQPKVSVIVPVSSFHRHVLTEALDSIENQTETQWELIVVNDTGFPLPLDAYPYVRVVDTSGKCGAGAARNLGIQRAHAPLITFLDADDTFEPTFLEATLDAYQRTRRYAYTDWISINKAGQAEVHETPEYSPGDVFRRTSMHSINVLIPRQWCLAVGGFDEGMTAWEDVDFFMKLAAAGYCGTRVALPLMTYRYSTGQLRESGEVIKDQLRALLRTRYGDYMEGGNKVCGCLDMGEMAGQGTPPTDDLRVLYNGPIGMHQVIGPATKKSYGRRTRGDIFRVDVADAKADRESFVPLAEINPIQSTPMPPAPELVSA